MRTLAALRSLVWLTLYVTIMRLLGYRIARPASPRAPGAAPRQAAPAPPSSAAQPRAKPRYLDRDMCVGLLANISAAFAATDPVAAPAPRDQAPLIPTPAVAPSPGSTAPIHAAARQQSLRATHAPAACRAPTHPPPFSKSNNPPAPTHALFVTVS